MKHFHVISHTHWDREWYQPFEVFRHRLVDLLDRLLEVYREYPEFVFELDAQTICLEDYLDIRPERRAELEKYIRSGNLKVGPWYVQNDFYLTNGESTVRNLLLGSALAEEFGECARCGYVPDQFGLISQLPQIFRGFGIGDCVFGRGYFREGAELPNEFEWCSPDGSSVLGSFLNRWYNNAQRFPADPELAVLFLREIEAAQEKETVTSHRLLMNGVDHLEAQENLLPVLERLNRDIAPDEIHQSTLASYLTAVRNEVRERGITLRRESGELRYGSSDNVLQGTLSAWMPLKRENVRMESAVTLQLEPFYSFLEHSSGDALYDRDYFRYLWKCLLKNHAHDSICGCSTDRVHEDNLNRFARLGDLTDDLRKRGAIHFWNRLDRDGLKEEDYLIAIFNPLPFRRSGIVPAEIFLPLSEKPESIRITDPAGNPIRFAVRSTELRSQTNYSAINLPGQIPALRIELDLAVEELPPNGVRVCRLRLEKGELPKPSATTAEAVLENRFLRFRVAEDGRCELLDRESGDVFEDVVRFTDEVDTGYSYNFHPAPGGTVNDLGSPVRVTPFTRGLTTGIRAEYEFELPREYDFDLRRPCTGTVRNRLTVEYLLDEFSRHVAVHVTIENNAGSHRLRARIQSGINSETSFASAPFAFEERNWKTGRHNNDHPDSGVIVFRSSERQLCCLNEGLSEYEALPGGAFALTLLRCAGYVTRRLYDETGRYIRPGVEWSSPGGQLIGQHSFRFALRSGNASFAELAREHQAFLSPAFAAFDSVDPHKLTGGRPCDQCSAVRELFFRDLPTQKQNFPHEMSGLELGGEVIFSALKKAEDGIGSILRVYNPEPHENPMTLKLPEGFQIAPVQLNESAATGAFDPVIPPCAIRTFRIGKEE